MNLLQGCQTFCEVWQGSEPRLETRCEFAPLSLIVEQHLSQPGNEAWTVQAAVALLWSSLAQVAHLGGGALAKQRELEQTYLKDAGREEDFRFIPQGEHDAYGARWRQQLPILHMGHVVA
jgi:hypothetical protein